MTESFILQVALIGNVLAVLGSLVVATKYYFASKELHQALHKQSEQDGLRYAQSFQTQLWQERKDALERELTAFKRAHEAVSLELVQTQERFNGLEQAYHEAREELHASINLVNQVQSEENKRKKKRVG
jgi:predicted  nucleic acid-binding Zn-ribbon protein